MITRRDLVACARQFVGVRFTHQGRSREGLDCLGLLLITAQECGIEFDCQLDVPNYGHRPDVHALESKLGEHLWAIPIAEAQMGDIILLKVDRSPQHLALLSDYGVANEKGMIHAYAPARKVVEHRYDEGWRKATHAAFQLPNLN